MIQRTKPVLSVVCHNHGVSYIWNKAVTFEIKHQPVLEYFEEEAK